MNLERLLSGDQWWDCNSTREAFVHSEPTQTAPSLPSGPGPRITPTAPPPPTRHCPRQLNGKGTKHTNLIFAQSHTPRNKPRLVKRRAMAACAHNRTSERAHGQRAYVAGSLACGPREALRGECSAVSGVLAGWQLEAAAIALTRSNPSPLLALDSTCVLNSSAQVSWNRNTSDALMCARAMVRRVTVCGAQNTYTHRRGGGGHGKRRRPLKIPDRSTVSDDAVRYYYLEPNSTVDHERAAPTSCPQPPSPTDGGMAPSWMHGGISREESEGTHGPHVCRGRCSLDSSRCCFSVDPMHASTGVLSVECVLALHALCPRNGALAAYHS